MTDQIANLDPQEAEAFNRLASRWWDPEGESRALHDINGPRVDWILERAALAGEPVLDVGCGGGLLSEALARAGAQVTAIDVADRLLDVARLHKLERESAGERFELDYRKAMAEELLPEHAGEFAAVCCLEMLEHVPDPDSVVAACAQLVRPGGNLFFSTINRTPLSWAAAIFGAEYLLGLVARGTHRYERLIRPAELADSLRRAGLEVIEISGMRYNPLTRTVHIGDAPRVNYLVHARRGE